MSSPAIVLQWLGEAAAHLPGCGHAVAGPAAAAVSAVLVLLSGGGSAPHR